MNRSLLPLACMAAYTCGAHASASALLLHDTRHAGDPPMAKSGICYIDDGATENVGGDGTTLAKGTIEHAANADEAGVVGDPPSGIGRKQSGFSLVELMGALGIWFAGVMGVSTVAPYAKAAIAWVGQLFS